jgi:hypothetical protein
MESHVAESRKPITVLWIRHGKGRSIKVELFEAAQFPCLERFTDKRGQPVTPNNIAKFYRLRLNGVWFPRGQRALFTRNQCVALIKKAVFA